MSVSVLCSFCATIIIVYSQLSGTHVCRALEIILTDYKYVPIPWLRVWRIANG